MAILTPVIKLVVFRQSLRPHSAIAFLVEFLCFVLELLDKEKDLAKIFGIVCACDTLIFTLLDLIQSLIEEEVKIQRCGRVFWLYTNDGSLYWHTLNAYLLMLCIVHVIGSTISYVSHKHYLVLLPLFAAGLELVPQEAYRVLGPDQESGNSIEPLNGPLNGIELEQGMVVHVEPLQEPLDGIELEQELVPQETNRVLGPDQESQDSIGPLNDPSDGKDQNLQDDIVLDQESQDCIIAPHQCPLDGIDLQQETVVHVEPLQDPLDGIELEQEVAIHVGPNDDP
ncbi:hypothetical protein AtNW77_Chr5g0125841 [Arabidopsis thaliana]|uniref:Uncharacterized protein n=2 Tax=Arabidopsis TaxID=3701 RepID=A0A178UL48_ARATH|nr:hypothetical protein ISN45_At05g037760 [Arabidopsis thaliana x Arabidopsis arenosa]OAO94027.1 hypothetical protein AXX17_AT5G40940 [Arabidopsis thaliana]VYS69104.1 unnamed protein product [Arabidopsis thaliana]